MPSEENGLHPIAPPILEHGARRQPSRSGGQRQLWRPGFLLPVDMESAVVAVGLGRLPA
jgi:hypothetical protein